MLLLAWEIPSAGKDWESNIRDIVHDVQPPWRKEAVLPFKILFY